MAKKTIAQLFDLSGKGAIVTGGGMGIGRAIVMRLAEAGAAVMIVDIDMDAAGKVVQRVKEKGGKAEAIKADIRSLADAKKVAEATVKAFGSLDILVNNAGIYPISNALETTEELWDRTLDINLKGTFFFSQAAAREMVKAKRGGRIINMASIDAVHPMGEVSHYNASKGGVLSLTKALALEWGASRNHRQCGSAWQHLDSWLGEAQSATGSRRQGPARTAQEVPDPLATGPARGAGRHCQGGAVLRQRGGELRHRDHDGRGRRIPALVGQALRTFKGGHDEVAPFS